MKALMTGFMVLVCFMSNAAAGAEPQAILHVLPTEESLGQHWKREVSLLFDPLSKPAVITPEASTLPESFKNEQLDAVANPQNDVSGWGNAQYTLHLTNGPAVYEVQIYRYRDRLRLADDFDQLLRVDSELYQHSPVTGLGDAAVFYRNPQGTDSTVWFRSAEFKVWISPSRSVTSWEQDVNLQNLAIQLNQRIVQRTVQLTGDPRSEQYKTAIIFGTWAWDVESNSLGDRSEADFWWKWGDDNEGYLLPLRGAVARIVEEPDFDAIDADYVRRVELSKEEIPGAALKPGVAIIFRTAKGKCGKLQVLGYKALHDFNFAEAAYLSEDWKTFVLSKPNIRQYHLQLRWTLLE